MRIHKFYIALFLLPILLYSKSHAQIHVVDDAGNDVVIDAAAQRIVTLAPYLAENIFSAGAGDKLVGTVDFSDYPVVAKQVRRVGNYTRLDLEAIVSLRPDLVIAWQSGNTAAHIERLRSLGIKVYMSEPSGLKEIATEVERFGKLAGTEKEAAREASAYRSRLANLTRKYSNESSVSTFYQIWHQPLATVGGEQIISSVIHLCGGKNVFGNLKQLAPVVSIESVIAANPEAIIASGSDASRPEWLDRWKDWKMIAAVGRDNLFSIPPELMQRHTFRLLDGAQMLCEQLSVVRSRR